MYATTRVIVKMNVNIVTGFLTERLRLR
jgi:hypothetical protein